MNLMREILNGVWMLPENEAQNMFPLINRFLQGETIDFKQMVHAESPYGYSNPNEATTGKRVVVLPIKGTILKYDYCGDMGMISLDHYLKEIISDNSVGAVVLDMDSGGGEASYMHNVAETLQRLRAEKPVLGYYSGLCASACYYIGSQCTKLYASSPVDRVGSVGTMITVFRRNPEFKDFEYVVDNVYANKSTEKNIEFEEALQGKYDAIRTRLLDPINEQFIKDVNIGRNTIDESVFTGKIMMSDEAIKLNVIDGVKSLEDVIQEAFSLIKN